MTARPDIAEPVIARALRVRGAVQGVGFRPHVWRLARRCGLAGTVANDAEGVIIRVRGPEAAIEAFVRALKAEAPPLARITAVEVAPLPADEPLPADFRIDATAAGAMRTQVPADAAPCPACLKELRDPADRRYRYPFLNCTHCGPRLTIIAEMPYDRPNTSMAAFPMCPACRAEYENPADRRFHAQPVACPDCGPQVWLTDAGGTVVARRDEAIRAAIRLLEEGRILAVRGVGGWHLMVDATDEEALIRLRRRKRRPAKPFALMARDLEVIRRWRTLSKAEEECLKGRDAPILLLETPGAARLPEAVAPGLDVYGFMLPPSPLHQLLADAFDRPLVCTSGNRSGQPQCIGNDEALNDLGDIADAFLMHDREIVNRVDDSVLRMIDGAPVPLRRSRGLAPAPVPLPPGFDGHPAVLAVGGELKNTFCLLKDGEAILSHHIGDLEEARTRRDWLSAMARYESLFAFAPEALAADMHPAYASTQHAEARARTDGLPLVHVQHHHAHLAAVMAEHGLPFDHPPVLGLILDGIGYGPDGTGWGAELLLGDYGHFVRLAGLSPAPLPGGEQAMREPWRNLAARFLTDESLRPLLEEATDIPAIARLHERPLPTIAAMIEKGVNAPLASSAGRLFDAVAELLDLAPDRLSYEGEAAMRLEQAAWRALREGKAADAHALRLPMPLRPGDPPRLDPAPLLAALVEGRRARLPVERLALAFHESLARALADCALKAAAEQGVDTVVLSGGVMQNRLLAERLAGALRAGGLDVRLHRKVPPNDGGLSLGQAVIAACRLMQGTA